MSQLYAYDSEAGTNGSSVTTTESGLSSVLGTWTYSNAHPPGGSLAMRTATSSSTAQLKTPTWTAAGQIFCEWTLYVEALPAALTAILQPLSTSTLLSEVRLGPSGQIQVRNGSSTQIAVSANGLISAGQFVRIRHWQDAVNDLSQTQVWVGASGAAIRSGSAAYDTGSITCAATPTSCNNVFVGVNNATTATLHFDDLYFDNASFAVTTVSLAEAGSGADALAVTGKPVLADVGSSADAVTVAQGIALADTGAASDALTVSPRAVLVDTAAGADALTVAVRLTLAETASGADGSAATVPIALADAATAADAVTASARFQVWDGSRWRPIVPLVWNGSSWVAIPVTVTP